MNKKQTRLSESEKLSILVEYYSGGHSINSIAKKYGLSCCTHSYWIKRYPIDSVLLSLPQESIEEVMAKKKANKSEDEIARLQARIKALEKALAYPSDVNVFSMKIVKVSTKISKSHPETARLVIA